MKHLDKLASSANQIAQFFRSYPHDQAVAGIAHHLEAYWTPGMRKVLADGLDDVPQLDALVVEAVSTDVAARVPIGKAGAGPGKLGELGAVDAG